MVRVAALVLVASTLLLHSGPGQAQIQRPPVQQQQPPPMQQQQPQMQMQQMSLEQRRAMQMPGTLVVEKAGTGSGKVESREGHTQTSNAPGGGTSTTYLIDCGTRCDYIHRQNSPPEIHLKAVPGGGAMAEWAGACTGRRAVCVIPMSADARHRVVVTFEKPRLTIRLQGSGSITSNPGLGCSGRDIACNHEYSAMLQPDGSAVGPVVTLSRGGAGPIHWSGCDGGSGQVSAHCRVTLRGVNEVVATFPVQLKVSRSGDGAGHVGVTPQSTGGCGVPPTADSWCALYLPGTDVVLTASGEFTRWTAGACSGQVTPTCRFRIASGALAAAQFTKPPPPQPKKK